ncbi:phosphatidic acid phosphatase [Chloroflexota bacterium]
MRKRTANLLSYIFSPFLVSLVLILLVSLESTASIFDALKWSLILIALSVLPVYLFTVYLVRSNRLDSIITAARKQRTKVYVLSLILGAVSSIILFSLKAPPIIAALFTTGFAAVAIFMCINLWWKISIHTAFISVFVAVMVILYGFIVATTIVLVPLVAWARIELNHHSLAQATTGALLAPSILVAVFSLFDLL